MFNIDKGENISLEYRLIICAQQLWNVITVHNIPYIHMQTQNLLKVYIR